MSTGKVVLGTLAGFAVGTIVGILFAPEKGSTTRRNIMDKANGYADDLKDKFDELSDSLTEKLKIAKHDAQDLLDNGKEKYQEAKNEVKKSSEYFK